MFQLKHVMAQTLSEWWAALEFQLGEKALETLDGFEEQILLRS
jgi:hypothetical protein